MPFESGKRNFFLFASLWAAFTAGCLYVAAAPSGPLGAGKDVALMFALAPAPSLTAAAGFAWLAGKWFSRYVKKSQAAANGTGNGFPAGVL